MLGQQKYWVPKTVRPPEALKPHFCSEWLQICSYELSKEDAIKLSLNESDRVLEFQHQELKLPKKLGFALEQIEGNELIKRGLTGKGVKIGIIDGGFLHAPKDPSLQYFFENNKVVAYRDYINPEAKPFGGLASQGDNHGNQVWKMIGGIEPQKEIRYGIASEAQYYLARTDHEGYEKRIEEDYLIAALEWMQNEGVRLVNISLGYTQGFNDPSQNYLPAQMDGQTSKVAQAVDHAFFDKNMLIVVAAGNDAQSDWLVVSTPADARGALSVGATKLGIWDKMDYSSIGPASLPYIKPNIGCFSASGTSFAAPVITGLAAALMEYDSSLSVKEIRQVIEQSGHLYPYANNYLGYGVPRSSVIFQLLGNGDKTIPPLIQASRNSVRLKHSSPNEKAVVYHKITKHHVATRSFLHAKKKKLPIKRWKKAAFSTVLIGEQVFEIEWIH